MNNLLVHLSPMATRPRRENTFCEMCSAGPTTVLAHMIIDTPLLVCRDCDPDNFPNASPILIVRVDVGQDPEKGWAWDERAFFDRLVGHESEQQDFDGSAFTSRPLVAVHATATSGSPFNRDLQGRAVFGRLVIMASDPWEHGLTQSEVEGVLELARRWH